MRPANGFAIALAVITYVDRVCISQAAPQMQEDLHLTKEQMGLVFTAFITWSFQPDHTERGGYEATGVDYLRTLALARIVLDNVDNLQASWVTQGGKVGQLSLAYGANDMGSVMIEENVVRAAGASYCMDEVEIVRNIEDAGFAAKRRNMHYEVLGDPIFREREVPRMLELATAREDGDDSVPAELVNYPARSRAGKASGTSKARVAATG